MNYNNYFKFFYILNKNNLIKEKTKVFPVLKNKIIQNKNIIKKEKEIEMFVCEFKLENNKILLIKDLPLNFLISHTILLGEKTNLYEFKIDDKIFISEEKIMNLFENISNKKQISPDKFYNLKFSTNFKIPKIISELKSYLSQNKKIDFNKIHLTQNNYVENFVPTGKSTHLNLAKEMQIPTINLIENNYIKNSSINIYDSDKLKKILKPIKIINEKKECKICKKNKILLFNDISTDFYFEIPNENIINKIENLEKTNFEKEKIIKDILNKKIIKLSQNYGKYYLPIWKSIQEQKYLKIQNIKEFEELTGMPFKETTENFKDLYLQYKSGEQVLFKEKSLKNDLTKTIENFEKEEHIEFENLKELILKLIFNENTNIKTISKIKNFDKNLIKKTINHSNQLLKYTIEKSIEKNKFPQKIKTNSNIENYFCNLNYLINELKKDFQITGDKKKIIEKLFNINLNLKKLIHNISLKFEELYFLLQIIENTISILIIVDNDKSKEITENYNEYFKDYKFTIEKYPKINFEIINLFNDIIKTNNYKFEKYIFIKNTNLEEKYFNSKNILQSQPTFKTYIKPNNKILKKIFKYNYKEISNQIKKLNQIEIKEIKLNNTSIPIKKEYYFIFYKYDNYKTILNNEYFSILTQK